MTTMLDNGIDAIRAGVEDFDGGDPHRLGTALRNVFAGILLLLKEQLVQAANGDEAVVHARVKPTMKGGELVWRADGNNTIDVHGIQKRFKTMGLTFDFKTLAKIQRLRNEVEHRYLTQPRNAVAEAIAQAFVLVEKSLRKLGEDPVLRLGDVWQVMLNENALYDELRVRCGDSYGPIDDVPPRLSLADAECPQCSSSLLAVVSGDGYYRLQLQCLKCGERASISDVAVSMVDTAYGGSVYEAMKDGCRSPVATCPSCNEEAYLVDEDRCPACGESRSNTTCDRCGCELEVDESDETMCSYCLHMYDKMMAE